MFLHYQEVFYYNRWHKKEIWDLRSQELRIHFFSTFCSISSLHKINFRSCIFSSQMQSQTAYNIVSCSFFSSVLSVGLLILNGLVWPMGSGFVLSALASTGAWEYISGKISGMYYGVDCCGLLSQLCFVSSQSPCLISGINQF